MYTISSVPPTFSPHLDNLLFVPKVHVPNHPIRQASLTFLSLPLTRDLQLTLLFSNTSIISLDFRKGFQHLIVFETRCRVELVIPHRVYLVNYVNCYFPFLARTDSLSSQQMHRIDHSENGGQPMSDSRSARSAPPFETESGSRIQHTH
jgi:hypothetical protein